MLLSDLAARAPDLTVWYTDAGALPRAALFGWIRDPFAFSIHTVNGTALAQAALFLFQGACAVGLLIGLRTPWMALLSWFLMVSLQDRNPLVFMGGADTLLRLMLFWSLFLPLGTYASLDAAYDPSRKTTPVRHFSLGTAAILLQVAMMYLMTSAYKWRTDIWRQGTALRVVLSNEIFAKPALRLLLPFPALMAFLTHSVLWLELLAPLLLFSPMLTGPVRTVAALGLMAMHLGFVLFLDIDFFQMVSLAGLTLFLPSWLWDTLMPKFRAPAWVRSARIRPAMTRLGAFLKGFTSDPRHETVRPAPLRDACVIVFFGCVLSWNLASILPSRYRMLPALRALSRAAHLDQQWGMFARPLPPTGWFVMPGALKDGTEVDLWRGGAPLSWEKPDPWCASWKGMRWRKYLFRLLPDQRVAREYARYLCRSWNAAHGGERGLVSLEIDYMTVRPDGGAGAYGKRILLRQHCSAGPKRHS